MKHGVITQAKILTYSGTLPLVISLVLIFFPVAGLDHVFMASAYSAIIISFLCGIHWAICVLLPDKSPSSLLLSSNIIALLAWISLLITDSDLKFVLQIGCFLSLLVLDFKLHHLGILPEWFYRLRFHATMIVVACLAILAWL